MKRGSSLHELERLLSRELATFPQLDPGTAVALLERLEVVAAWRHNLAELERVNARVAALEAAADARDGAL